GLARSLASFVPVRVMVKHLGAPRFEHYRDPLEAAGISVESIGSAGTERIDSNADLIPPLDRNLYALTRTLAGSFRNSPPRAVHGWMDEVGTAAALAATLCGVPHVLVDTRSLRPTWFETRGVESIRSVLRVLLEMKRIVLVNNSQAGADDYKRWLHTN